LPRASLDSHLSKRYLADSAVGFTKFCDSVICLVDRIRVAEAQLGDRRQTPRETRRSCCLDLEACSQPWPRPRSLSRRSGSRLYLHQPILILNRRDFRRSSSRSCRRSSSRISNGRHPRAEPPNSPSYSRWPSRQPRRRPKHRVLRPTPPMVAARRKSRHRRRKEDFRLNGYRPVQTWSAQSPVRRRRTPTLNLKRAQRSRKLTQRSILQLSPRGQSLFGRACTLGVE
jgi:hypothetical protein